MRFYRILPAVVVCATFSHLTAAQTVPCSAITRNPQVLEALLESRSDEGLEPANLENEAIPATALQSLQFSPITVQPGDALYLEYRGEEFTVYGEYAGGDMTAFGAPPQASFEEWRKGILLLDHRLGLNQKLVRLSAMSGEPDRVQFRNIRIIRAGKPVFEFAALATYGAPKLRQAVRRTLPCVGNDQPLATTAYDPPMVYPPSLPPNPLANPYGATLTPPSPTAMMFQGGGSTNHYKFTGKEQDEESGLYNFGARMYSPTMGRFMTPDPKAGSARLDDPQSWNRYAYTRNNPLKYIDPDGKDYQLAYNPKTNTATMTINIVLNGPGANKQLAADWQRDTNTKIGGKHKTSFGMTLDIRVNVTTDPKAVPALGRKEMNVDSSHQKTEVTPTADGKHANQGTGTPSELSDPNVRTHETLHYGNLGDQYDPTTKQPLPGQEGTIMGDPRNPNSQFTQQEIDQMGRNACNNSPSCRKQNQEPKKPAEHL